jgi:RNA polymerase sigma factor (sigma-70 family)
MHDGLGTEELRRRARVLYLYCRLQRPAVAVAAAEFDRHLQRTFDLFRAKSGAATWDDYLANIYAVDWYVVVGCLTGDARAWEALFAARAGRTDCLLVDALRARAVRLYPRDEERQDSAVTEFWGQLLVADGPGARPVLARYDGQRPLVPWLIRVFQNAHVSHLRQGSKTQPLPEDDVALPLPAEANGRWHEAFCLAAREAFADLADAEWLVLGLRLRYRLSQREVAGLLGVHEGNVSRQIAKLRDKLLDAVARRLREAGWTGDDLSGYVLSEMGGLLLDEPRLAADQLARLLAARGKKLPPDLRR